jgi:hypothetical protein
MKRCPICFGLVNKKATKCKHCSSDLSEGNEYYEYINNGFSLIERECRSFNQKIESIKGSIFPRHQYSEEELLHSSHLDKIRSIAGKMGNDIENWEKRGKLPEELKDYYEDRILQLNDRFQFMIRRIKSRKYSIWEKISDFFMCSYYFIINIALYHLKNIVIPYMKSSDKLMTPFTLFRKTAEGFENFLDSIQDDAKNEILHDFSESRRA